MFAVGVIPAGRYVVVGASGILAPLGHRLRGPGFWTVGISRGARLGAGSWDERVALDTQNHSAVAVWVAEQEERAIALVAYTPAVAEACWPLLASVAGRCIVVATTHWIDVPFRDVPWRGLGASVVQLGWARTRSGTRWHTPEDVSQAVARVLAATSEGGTVVLGETAPLAARPLG